MLASRGAASLLIIGYFLLPLVMALATAQLYLNVTGLAVHRTHLEWKSLLLVTLRASSGIATRRVGHWRDNSL